MNGNYELLDISEENTRYLFMICNQEGQWQVCGIVCRSVLLPDVHLQGTGCGKGDFDCWTGIAGAQIILLN